MHEFLNIFMWAVFIIPGICFVVALLDGVWCLVTKREGLLDFFGYH